MIISNHKNFTPAPSGLLAGKLVAVKDLGKTPTKFGEKNRLRLDWETTEITTPEGVPYRISKFYTATLAPKSTLLKDLTSWVGNSVVTADKFDLDSLVGMNCQLLVVHISKDGKIYANVEGVFPAKGEVQ